VTTASTSSHIPLEQISAYATQHPEANVYFRQKYGWIQDAAMWRRFTSLVRYELGVAGIEVANKVVLDAGCGSGIYSLLFVLDGAARVEAIDYFPPNIACIQDLAARFSLPIVARRTNIAATGLPDAAVDVVFCNEAISHFHDWRAFLEEAGRVLKPGGRILIADWNNGASPRVRRKTYDHWQESESGPFLASRFPPDGKHHIPYLFRRWMVIRRTFPELSDTDVFHLGLRTVGKGGEELLAVCRDFVRTRELPSFAFRRGVSQQSPEDGRRNEEPVDPREIVTRLARVGVQARACAYFGYSRSRLLPIVNRVAASLGNLALLASEKYIVFGAKSPR
jgi:SAM-dependent methyltransferase